MPVVPRTKGHDHRAGKQRADRARQRRGHPRVQLEVRPTERPWKGSRSSHRIRPSSERGVDPTCRQQSGAMRRRPSSTSRKRRASGLSAWQSAPWQFRVIADKPPKMRLTKEPQRLPRGSLKLSYKIEDDYGVVSAVGRITRAKPQPGDPATEWARREPKTGPRPPLERPPVLSLRLPRANARSGEAFSYHELTGHPWAGAARQARLDAKDQAGQVGSQPRLRADPATAPVHQSGRQSDRRAAPASGRGSAQPGAMYRGTGCHRDRAGRAVSPIAGPISGCARHIWRLQRDKSRAGLKSVVDQFWHVALRFEDGDLSEAERALGEAQEKLSKALQDGATDEEIRSLMNELRQALNNFMKQLQQQAENQPMQFPKNLSPDRIIRQQDLERMMRDIENMARQGSRDMAQQMLSQLRDMLEQLQNGQHGAGPGRASKPADDEDDEPVRWTSSASSSNSWTIRSASSRAASEGNQARPGAAGRPRATGPAGPGPAGPARQGRRARGDNNRVATAVAVADLASNPAKVMAKVLASAARAKVWAGSASGRASSADRLGQIQGQMRQNGLQVAPATRGGRTVDAGGRAGTGRGDRRVRRAPSSRRSSSCARAPSRWPSR